MKVAVWRRMRLFALLMCIVAGLSSLQATSRALLVGIGRYDTANTGWEQLNGDRDVDLLQGILLSNGIAKSNIRTLKNEQATKSAIMAALKELAAQCRQGDKVWFHFSGHGQPVDDLNGDEPPGDTFDESIIPFDACKTRKYKCGSSFYQGQNHIIDDELSPLFNDIKKKIGRSGHLMVTVDACFSRGIELDPLDCFTKQDIVTTGKPRGTDLKFHPDKNGVIAGIPRPKPYDKGGRLTVIAACREDERNFEYIESGSGKHYGALSYSLYLLLKKKQGFSKWEKYFTEGRYAADKIFVSEQHPKITIYK